MISTRGGVARLLAGVLISLAFLVATVSRVDLGEVGVALRQVDLAAVALAVPLVFAELFIRALRWKRLLRPIAAIPLSRSAAYLAIGYFANSMLPARLGDVARAFLAGRAFGVSRLAVLGSVVVERLADGVFILGLVVVLGLTVAGTGSLAPTAGWLVVLGATGSVGLVLAIAWLRRPRGGAVRVRVRSLVDRALLGAQALRSPAGVAVVVALTAAAFTPAIVVFALIASAAGVELTLLQSALVMGGLALSTSIPAAPGSIGTYEFVGLAMLTALGVDPEVGLAIVVVVHLVVTLPVALTGLVCAWLLHFRVADITHEGAPAAIEGADEDMSAAAPIGG